MDLNALKGKLKQNTTKISNIFYLCKNTYSKQKDIWTTKINFIAFEIHRISSDCFYSKKKKEKKTETIKEEDVKGKSYRKFDVSFDASTRNFLTILNRIPKLFALEGYNFSRNISYNKNKLNPMLSNNQFRYGINITYLKVQNEHENRALKKRLLVRKY